MLTKAEVAELLNRPLTTAEDTNFDLYLKIAEQRLGDLLCIDICGDQKERTYETREGYRAAYIDPFTSIYSVKIDGNEVSEDDYVIKQNDSFRGSWYNVVLFDRKQTGKRIVVEAKWGFKKYPTDLKLMLAKLFNQNSLDQKTDATVQRKRIEDFEVTYKDSATYDELLLANVSVISKYSQCDVGLVRHGYTRPVYYY